MVEFAYDFEWDAHKAAINIKKHSVSFELASTVFSDPMALTVFDEKHSDYEERWFTLGMGSTGVLLAVSHTFQETNDTHGLIRIISARPATKREGQSYTADTLI